MKHPIGMVTPPIKLAQTFPIVFADPPWEYEQRAKWAESSKFGGGATGHYNVSDVDDMAAWAPQFQAMKPPMGKNADGKAIQLPGVMLMWFVVPQIEEAYRVMRAWGYEPVKPIWWWRKITETGKEFKGTGHYTYSNLEGVLLGHAARVSRTGSLIVDERLPIAARAGRCRDEIQSHPHPRHLKTYTAGKLAGKTRSVITHSAKPPIFLDLAVELFGDLPRIDVFARVHTPGWHAIGDQLEGGARIASDRIIYPFAPPGAEGERTTIIRTDALAAPVDR